MPRYEDGDAIGRLFDQLNDFRDELKIDRDRLDEEIAKQSDLYFRCSETAAMTASYRDRAKHDLALMEAEVAQELRGAGGEGRVTEGSIKEQLALDPDVKSASLKHIAWKRAADEWKGMQDALEQKNYMIREMSHLYSSGYYTITSAGQSDNEHKEARAAEARRRMTEQRHNRPQMPRRQ